MAPFIERIRAHRVSGFKPVGDPNWRPGSQPELQIEEVLTQNGIDLDSQTAAVASELFSYVREIQGAETLAQVLHEAPWGEPKTEMPWEFFYDTARHCWDEVRHFEMGVERLEELGVDLNTIPVPTANSQARGELDALERYALLVRVAEAPRFPSLRKKFDRLRERGDEASAAIVDFDHSDEITQVRFGEKWMPLLREKVGETRTLEQIVEECEPRYRATLEELLQREGESRILEESFTSE